MRWIETVYGRCVKTRAVYKVTDQEADTYELS